MMEKIRQQDVKMEASEQKKWTPIDISDIPHMEPAGIELLKRSLSGCKLFLEYGAGGSTVLAAKQGVCSIFSVESDRSFLDAVSGKLKLLEGSSSEFTPVCADIGPTGDWGAPTDKASASKWPNYCVQVWEQLLLSNTFPDVVLIDGRFRVACFLASLVFSQKGTVILFDDYLDRPQYHSVERFIARSSTAGRMAEFVVPANFDTKQVIMELVRSSASPA